VSWSRRTLAQVQASARVRGVAAAVIQRAAAETLGLGVSADEAVRLALRGGPEAAIAALRAQQDAERERAAPTPPVPGYGEEPPVRSPVEVIEDALASVERAGGVAESLLQEMAGASSLPLRRFAEDAAELRRRQQQELARRLPQPGARHEAERALDEVYARHLTGALDATPTS
jgi:hypothetical protein